MNLIYRILIIIASPVIFFPTKVEAQKKSIDTTAIQNWESLGYEYAASANGKYVYYYIQSSRKNRLIIADIAGNKHREFEGGRNPQFSANNQYFICIASEGLIVVSMRDFTVEVLRQAESVKISTDPANSFITYLNKGFLTLRYLKTKREINLGSVTDYILDDSSASIIARKKDGLEWINVSSLFRTEIYSGTGLGDFAIDPDGSRIVFSVNTSGKISIFKFSKASGRAVLLFDQKAQEFRDRTISEGGLRFNKNGELVLFNYKQSQELQPKDRSEISDIVSVWNYKDRFLQSNQEIKVKNKQGTVSSDFLYRGIASFSTGRILTPENADTLFFGDISDKKSWALLKSENNVNEVYWNENEWPQYKLLSLTDGELKNFLTEKKNVYSVQLSPSEKFVTWIDTVSRRYYTYEIGTGKVRDISRKLQETAAMGNLAFPTPYYIEGWLKDDSWILATDYYDMWLIDPLGNQAAICVTAGFGRKNDWSYRPILSYEEIRHKKYGDEIIFATLENSTKINGFAVAKLNMGSLPSSLSSGSYLDYFPGLFVGSSNPPRKAAKGGVYFIERQSDLSSKNLFVTRDFKTFKPLSDIHPEKNYKWFRGEMIRFTTRNGEQREGILYQPHDLDSTRKYPIIFNYYEDRSGERFKFLRPEIGTSNINVPWYLSRGYLVFIPNIHKRGGDLGESAVQTVVSAAEYLTRLYPWIDKARMGLQGHSYGGTVTNFLATHTNIFAAAQSSSGRSDHISMYGGIAFGGISLQAATEEFQNKMNATPWERPDVYIRNSPIFGIGKSTTPLLIAHGVNDGAVPFSQAVELFTGLRRAKKRVWLLEYNADHVFGRNSSMDFALRQQQFFDYYLKDAPPPLWMVEGIPARFRGIRSGLELDTSTQKP